jgi:hypothetical protein
MLINISNIHVYKLSSFFDVHVTVNRDKFLVIKLTRYTNFSNLFFGGNSTCFGQFLCPSLGVFHCTHSNGICHTGLQTARVQDQDGTEYCTYSIRYMYSLRLLMIEGKTYETCRALIQNKIN